MQRRHTRQKQIIQKIIEGPGKHMNAEEVMAVLKQEEPGIGIATVYRNLNLLCEEGVIQKISGQGRSFYDGNPAPHDHLYCTCCGEIFDIVLSEMKEVEEEAARLTGARIFSHKTALERICQKCQKDEEKKKQWN